MLAEIFSESKLRATLKVLWTDLFSILMVHWIYSDITFLVLWGQLRDILGTLGVL